MWCCRCFLLQSFLSPIFFYKDTGRSRKEQRGTLIVSLFHGSFMDLFDPHDYCCINSELCWILKYYQPWWSTQIHIICGSGADSTSSSGMHCSLMECTTQISEMKRHTFWLQIVIEVISRNKSFISGFQYGPSYLFEHKYSTNIYLSIWE